MKFALVLGLLASVNAFAVSADLSSSTTQHKLVDAEYKLIPTKVEYREIPGCRPDGEAQRDCTEVIVLESKPVITANVSYVDSYMTSEGNEKNWLSLNFEVSEFSAEEVASLKAAYPTWRHPFSNAGRKFARNVLSLEVKNVARTIQVVDVRNSHLCRVLENGEQDPTCTEVIVYKPATTIVKEVTVLKK